MVEEVLLESDWFTDAAELLRDVRRARRSVERSNRSRKDKEKARAKGKRGEEPKDMGGGS